ANPLNRASWVSNPDGDNTIKKVWRDEGHNKGMGRRGRVKTLSSNNQVKYQGGNASAQKGSGYDLYQKMTFSIGIHTRT
ncbi:MAG: hypothetical protein ACE5GQ_11520, partial [Nitrospinales bacterium]